MQSKEQRQLVKRHAFGVRSGVHSCICWLDEGTLLYPVGKSIVLHNVASNSQRFLGASVQSSGVTALAVSANKKFVAIAEGGANPQIQIVDTVTRKRRKVLSLGDLGSDAFIAMAFSADGRHLVTQGGAPNWSLHYWNWERSKPLAYVSIAQRLFPNGLSSASAAGGGAGGGVHNTSGNTSVGNVTSHYGGGMEGSMMAGAAGNQTSTTRTMTSQSPNGRKDAETLSATHTAGPGSTSLSGSRGAVQGGNAYGRTGRSASVNTSSSSGPLGSALVRCVSICPQDPLLMAVSGMGFMRFYKYTDGVLQMQPSCGYGNERNELFTTHTWLDAERVVAATQQGGLLLIEKGKWVGSIALHAVEFASYGTERSPVVTALQPTSTGFVAGTDQGEVYIYEYAEERVDECGFQRVCTLSLPDYEGGAAGRSTMGGGGGGSHAAAMPWGRPGAAQENTNTINTARQTTPASMQGGGGGSGAQGQEGNNSNYTSVPASRPRFVVVDHGTGTVLQSSAENAGHGPADSLTSPTAVVAAGRLPTLTSLPSEADKTHENTTSAAALMMSGRPNAMSSAGVHHGGTGGVPSVRAALGVVHLALDQSEENLALVTCGGKIFGLDFRQDWAKLQANAAAAAVAAAANANANNSTTAGGGGNVSALDATTASNALAATVSNAAGTNSNAAAPMIVASSSSSSAAANLFFPRFREICQPFHTGKINGMACSVRKPFLITSSADHTVRVWNTQTHRQEICEHFDLEPGAVALHPSGLMAVICFPDRVRVMNVLWNALRDRCTISFRNAQDVQFSVGGQYFAIAHGNLMDVFYSATCELHGQLRGHPQRIKDFHWCATTPYPTDNRLVTCSADGMVMDWNVVEAHKEAEHCDKRFQYVAITSDDRNVWAVAAPTSATALEVQWKVTLREMDRHNINSVNSAAEDYEFVDVALTTLTVASHQRLLFGGGEDGSLKVMSFPLQAGTQEAPLTAHAAAMAKMVLSFDESTLFTASKDGSIFVWDIREDGGRPRVQEDININATGSNNNAAGSRVADEVLVTPQEVEERRVEMESLQQQIEKLKTDLDSEEKRRNHEQNTRMRERAEEFKSDAATLQAEYAALWNAKAEQERAFVELKVEKEGAASHALEQLERRRQREVVTLEEQCNALQHTLDGDRLSFAQALTQWEADHAEARTQAAAHFHDVLTQRREMLEKLRRQVERGRQTNAETEHQLELDIDAESQAMMEKYQTGLSALRERFLHMKGEGAIMRKNAIAMEKEIEVRVDEVRLLESARLALGAQLADLQHDISQLHQDMDERDAVIGEKEKRIFALKKENQELEKHKFVLDHRIRQLKAQMEPKQREIAAHKARIKDKNDTLTKLHEGNLALRGNIEELKEDIVQQQQRVKQLLSRLNDFATYKSRFEKDVCDIAPALQEPHALRETVARLYNVHVASRNGTRIAQADPQIKHEFGEQLGYLATSVEALRRKVKADQERHKKEVSAMMVENMDLIREIQSLRGEIQQLRTRIAAEEAARRSGLAGGGTNNNNNNNMMNSAVGGGAGFAGRSITDEIPVLEEDMDDEAENNNNNNNNNTSKETPLVTPTLVRRQSTSAGGAAVAANAGRSGSLEAAHLTSGHGARRPASEEISRQPRRSSASSSRRSVRPPPPPKALEENRMEIHMQRAYIEAMQRALAEAKKAGSLSSTSLPPIRSAS